MPSTSDVTEYDADAVPLMEIVVDVKVTVLPLLSAHVVPGRNLLDEEDCDDAPLSLLHETAHSIATVIKIRIFFIRYIG